MHINIQETLLYSVFLMITSAILLFFHCSVPVGVCVTLLAEDLLNFSIMCVTDCFMDISSSICNCLKPLRQLTVITYGEKLDVSSTMHVSHHFNSLRVGNEEYSKLSGSYSSCLPSDTVILKTVTLDYLHIRWKQTGPSKTVLRTGSLPLQRWLYFPIDY